MLYLDINQSKEIVVTAGELATLYTATYSVSNAPDVIIDLIHFMAYGVVGSTHQFNTSQAYIEDGGLINQSSVATITQVGNSNKWILECIGEGDCYINYRGWNNNLWELHLIVSGFAPDPTIETVALPTYFTWKITDADTNNSYIFTADDLSPTPWYYNMFSFSVIPGATYGLTQGVIPAPQGVYSYCVYQTQTQYDLATTNLLEKGILNIEGTYSIINTFTQSSGNVVTFKNL